MYGDFNDIFDDISRAARSFQREFSGYVRGRQKFGDQDAHGTNNYDQYVWPPVNIYTAGADGGALVFEFGLAGFQEEDINLTFHGDYMELSALCRGTLKNCAGQETDRAETRYFKKSLCFDSVEKQKYYVPADRYAQEKTKAVFKNGLLSVSVPVKEPDKQNDGIKVEISA
ncbi:MAG: Hsp20/alpha crystallin family protein [Spirochaetaceae bacterium]|nr:Hsp20/alpha crystallin family protein [Spirochaetaceae bacterium]